MTRATQNPTMHRELKKAPGVPGLSRKYPNLGIKVPQTLRYYPTAQGADRVRGGVLSLFPPSEPRQLAEQTRNRDHDSSDPCGQTRKQQEIAQERRHIAPPLYLPCACPSWHSKGLAFVRCPTHETSRIVSRLPQDVGDRMSLRQFIPAVIVGLLLAALLLWLTLGWLLDAITLSVG